MSHFNSSLKLLFFFWCRTFWQQRQPVFNSVDQNWLANLKPKQLNPLFVQLQALGSPPPPSDDRVAGHQLCNLGVLQQDLGWSQAPSVLTAHSSSAQEGRIAEAFQPWQGLNWCWYSYRHSLAAAQGKSEPNPVNPGSKLGYVVTIQLEYILN